MTSSDISELCSQIQAIDLHPGGKTTPHTILVVPLPEHTTSIETLWKVITAALQEKPHTYKVTLKNVGTFDSRTIQLLASHNVQVTIPEIPRYIQLLTSSNTSLDDPNLPPLQRAAITNQPTLVTSSQVNEPDATGRTALHYAVYFKHVRVIQALVANGALPDFTTRDLYSPLCQAALANQTDLVTLLTKGSTASKVATFFSTFQSEILAYHFEQAGSADKVTEVATCLFAIHDQRKPNCNRFLNAALSSTALPEVVKEYLKEEKVRRTLYHSWAIDWNLSTTAGFEIRQKIFYNSSDTLLSFTPVYGGYQGYFLNKMQEGTTSFSRLYEMQQWLVTLSTSLRYAADQERYNGDHMYMRWVHGEPIIVNIKIESPGHAVTVLIWNHYIFICNKGIASRKSVEAFVFDKYCLTSSVFNRMKKPFESQYAYMTYFFTELFMQLKFRQREIETEFEKMCKEPEQSVGNCAWESPKTCVRAYFMFSALKENGLLGARTFKLDQAKSLAASQIELFNNWELNQQLDHLAKYLKVITVPNRKFVSNYELLNVVCKQYKMVRAMPWILPAIQKKITNLEATYPLYLK